MLSGATAGMAGAVLAQTSEFVSLDMLGFDRSAEVMMVATLGGTGTIHGVVLGAAAFGVRAGRAVHPQPEILAAGPGPGADGLRPGAARRHRGRPRTPAPASRRRDRPALQTRGLEVRFGSFTAVGGVDLVRRTRRAPRPDRTQRRRQDHASSTALTGSIAPDRRAGAGRRRRLHGPAAAAARPSRPGPHLPDQPAVPQPDGAGERGPRDLRARRQVPRLLAQRRRGPPGRWTRRAATWTSST